MRARNIKPGFFKNADLAECSIWARYLAPGLWMMADKEGRLQDRPKQIKGEVFPYDDIDVNSLLDELVLHQHIIRYEVDGKRFIQICTFTDHQRPHSNEVPSTIPAPLLTKVESTSNQGAKCLSPITNPLCPSLLNPSSLNPSSLNAECPTSAKAPKSKISLGELTVDHNAEWLAKKRSEGRYLHHDECFILEQFKNYCLSKGKKYADYIAAYQNAFEWERCQPKPGKQGGDGAIGQSKWLTAAEQIIAEDRADAARLRGG